MCSFLVSAHPCLFNLRLWLLPRRASVLTDRVKITFWGARPRADKSAAFVRPSV